MKIIYCLLSVFFFSCKREATNNTTIANDTASLKWIDCREGELAPEGYYKALDSVIKKWSIRYERIESGCEVVTGERQRYEQNNERYFRLLEKQFGKDWRRRFYTDVSRLDHLLNKRE